LSLTHALEKVIGIRGKRYVSVLIVIILAIQPAAISSVSAASSAILVYSHGFAKDVKFARNGNLLPINQTTVFTQDDMHVYAYAIAAFYSANVTWEWDDPNGQLYLNSTFTEQCFTSPCYILGRMDIVNRIAATKFGRWMVTLWNGNVRVYTDFFYVTPVVTQEDSWSFSVERSANPFVRANLTVTIHPNNGTWTHYQIYIPYAANLTAIESGTNRNLTVTHSTDNLVVVDFGAPRSDGYTFSIIFDVLYGLYNLNGSNGGVYAFEWSDWPWQRFNDPHPIYESFTVTLPKGAELIDIIGGNAITVNYAVAPGNRSSIQFDTTVIQQIFGWTIIYRDSRGNGGSPNAIVLPVTTQTIPILPLTLSDINIWSAVMSVFLLIASELASPLYAVTGSRILLNRKRLRIVGLLLVAIFLISTGYRLFTQFGTVPK
jgi:hypothetical protein